MIKPIKVSGADVAFGAEDYSKYLPPNMGDKPSQRALDLFSDWFFLGLEKLDLTPADGIDEDEALAHIKALMSSWAPKHEVKTKAVALLLDTWFTSFEWVPRKRERR